jgi:hypothetical protein
MFKEIDQKQRNFTLVFELVTHTTYEMKVVVMNAWGLCSSGMWGLVSLCRSEFDSLSVRLSPLRCFTCLLGLHGVQWAVGNNRGVRKLARTPHANKKKSRCNDSSISMKTRVWLSQDVEHVARKEYA